MTMKHTNVRNEAKAGNFTRRCSQRYNGWSKTEQTIAKAMIFKKGQKSTRPRPIDTTSNAEKKYLRTNDASMTCSITVIPKVRQWTRLWRDRA